MLRNGDYDFAFVQEAHSMAKEEHLWRAEWGGSTFCSHGLSNARGVMTLLPRKSDLQVIQQFSDSEGRLVILQVKKGDSIFTIANIYAPTQDHPEDQIALIDQLEEEITKMQPNNVVIGGDFNLCMDSSLDRGRISQGRINSDGDRYKARIEALNESFHLVDAWRFLNPTTRQFSFRRGHSVSRLDYWLTSAHLMDSDPRSAIVPYPLSDHAAITIKIGASPSPTGPGLWRLDNSLLDRKVYRLAIQELLLEEANNPEDLSPCSHWEWVKFRIKSISRQIAKDIKTKNREHEKDVNDKYQDLLKKADADLPYDSDALRSYERELKEIQINKACRAIERTRTSWALGGEKPSKYFLNLQKLRRKNNTISQLIKEDGTTISDHKDILAEQVKYYQDLYSRGTSISDVASPEELGLCEEDIPSISETSKAELEGNYSEEELRKALGQLNKGKCPGSDGLTVEFYVAFWSLLYPILEASLQHSLLSGEL